MLFIAAVISLALCAAAFMLIAAYIFAWRVTRPGTHTYWDEYTFRPSDMGVPYESVRFTTGDGLQLTAWLMTHPDGRITVVLGNGYRERKVNLLPLAAGLWRQGLNVFLLDFRNQGESQMDTAQTMGWRERQDMLSALDAVQRRLPDTKIAAMGWSMGAVVSIFAAAQDGRIAAVVADSAYTDQMSILRHNFRQITGLPAWPIVPLSESFFQLRAGYRPSQVRPEDDVGAISPRPLLIIHGEEDDLCPVGHAHRLFARAGEPKELWIEPGAKHVGAYFIDPERYIARVVAFLRQHLEADAPS